MGTWGEQTAGGRQAGPAWVHLVPMLQRRKLRHWRESKTLREKLGLSLNWAATRSFIYAFDKYLLSTVVTFHLFIQVLLNTYYVPDTMITVFDSFIHSTSID